MHNVGGRLVGGEQLSQSFVQRLQAEGEDKRDRALGVLYDGGGPAGPFRQVLLEPSHVAEGGGHEDELRLGQLDERYLPGPAAVRVRVVVELVHHDLADVGVGAVPQRDGGQDLGRAADNRRLGVDGGVAGHHADVGRAEDVDQGEELLAHQRLDRRGVVAALPVGEGGEVGARRDQGFAGTGRGGQDHVRPRGDLDQRLFLMRVKGEALVGRPARERAEDRVRVRRGVVGRRGEQIGKRRHGYFYGALPGRLPGTYAAEAGRGGWGQGEWGPGAPMPEASSGTRAWTQFAS
jgi:hypothetical protein